MIDKSDRDWRWVMRQITRRTLLYSEMITAPAILHGKRDRLLQFDPLEKPLVLQLGWDEPEPLAEACRIATDYGYDEINLNCGCPSDKVQRHDFGACLMARPSHVARLVEAMSSATCLPVSVKHRIGIRSRKSGLSLETYEDLETVCFNGSPGRLRQIYCSFPYSNTGRAQSPGKSGHPAAPAGRGVPAEGRFSRSFY